MEPKKSLKQKGRRGAHQVQKQFKAPKSVVATRARFESKANIRDRTKALEKIEESSRGLIPQIQTTSKVAPLAEKFRPFHLSESIGNKDIVAELLGMIKLGDVPYSMVFWGAPGIGKTSDAKAWAVDYMIANGIFDKEGKQVEGVFDPILFMDRPIRMEDMVEGGVIWNFMTYLPPAPNVKRVLIADEGDRISREAILRLRQLLEKSGNTTFTIFTSNEPPDTWLNPDDMSLRGVQSRMRFFEFKPPTENELADRLKQIAAVERIEIAEDEIRQVVKDSIIGGDIDIRKALDNLSRYRSRRAGNDLMRRH